MKATPIELEGAVVAITGAGRGIGRATAWEFANRGANVALGDVDTEAAASVAAELSDGAEPFHLDVTVRASFESFIASAEDALGPVDVLVNNAGVMPTGRFLDEDEATIARTLDVNLWGPMHGMRIVLPGMIERGRGHIVNVISLAGKAHVIGLGPYVASKFGLLGLHRTVRDELAGTGVTASAILPSAVRTELSSGIELKGLFAVDPEDVAAAIAGTLERRPAEVAVPRWLRAADALPLVPAPIVGFVKRRLGEDRAIAPADEEVRAAYEARIRAGVGDE